MRTLITGLALGLMVAAAPAHAQTRNEPARTETGKLARQDAKFLKEAAGGGVGEVELGRLAQERAASPQVKQFGQHMVDDHTKANEQLKAVALKAGQVPSEQPSADARKLRDRLSKLSGQAFDREYMKEMVKDHEKDVKLFRDQARNGKDPDLKSFAQQTLPTLEQHLQQARQVAQQAGAQVSAR